jgi:hypothetical protein
VFTVGDQVRIASLYKDYLYVKDPDNKRRPKIGDIAEVRQVYGQDNSSKKGYQLNCQDFKGDKIWQLNFNIEQVELESVKNRKN